MKQRPFLNESLTPINFNPKEEIVSSNNHGSVAITWPELIEKYTGAVQYFIRKYEAQAQELAQRGSPQALVESFGGVALTLAQALVLLKADFSKGTFKKWLQFVPEAVKVITSKPAEHIVNAYFLLVFTLLAEIAGFKKPADIDNINVSYLTTIASNKGALTSAQVQSAALIAVFSNKAQLLPRFIDTQVPESFQPGEVFEFNYKRFIAYLAAALNQKARWEDVQPALESFLSSFPYKFAARTSDWVDLLLAVSIAARLQGSPIDSAADYLHAKLSIG